MYPATVDFSEKNTNIICPSGTQFRPFSNLKELALNIELHPILDYGEGGIRTLPSCGIRYSFNAKTAGVISLKRITDPKSSGADCKSAPAAFNMIDKYPEEQRKCLSCWMNDIR